MHHSRQRFLQLVGTAAAAMALFACGGGGIDDLQTTVPTVRATAQPPAIPGASAVALHLYQALYGKAPSFALLIEQTTLATADANGFARTLAGNFAATSDHDLALLVLNNLGISASSINANAYSVLLDALGQMFAGYGSAARGQIILNATNLLANLEGDATYGAAAAVFNNQASANYTYGSNPANTSPAVVFPGAPTGATATTSSVSQITLNWNAVSGASGYNVYRSTTAGKLGSKVNATALSATSFADTGLTANTPYFYRVTAVNSAVEGAASSEVSATTSASSSGGTVGVNWTIQNSAALGFTPNLRKIAWSGSRFVAVGGACNIRTSPDGVTWTARSVGAAACTGLSDVAWSGSQFIAVGPVPAAGSYATIFTSPDGVTWSPRSSGSSNNLRSIACSPSQGQCIAGGDSGTLRSSSDGVTWTVQSRGLSTSLSGGYSVMGMTWTGALWLGAVSLGGYIISSPDGITWTISSVGNAMYGWSNVASSGTQHVAFGPTGPYTTSTDGVTWTGHSFYGFSFETAVWTGSQFVAVGANGTVGTSADGITWTTQSPTPTVGLSGAVWTGTKIVAVGAYGIATSP